MVGGRYELMTLALALALSPGCGGKARGTESDPGAAARGGSEPNAAGSSSAGGTAPKPGTGGVANGGGAGAGMGGVQNVGGDGVAGMAAAGAAGAPSTDTCASDAECVLVGCCHWCMAIPVSEPDPLNCAVIDCAGLGCGEFASGAVEPRCVAGRCVTSISCDERLLPDEVVLPPCPDGTAHAIEPAGTTNCMPVGECSSVSSCAVCESAGLSCVVHESGGLTPLGPFSYHCVDVPAECNGAPSCDCMKTCSEPGICSEDGLRCTEFCPNC